MNKTESRRLDYLIKDEKKTPYDYQKLKKIVHSKEARRIIDTIIKQEKQHEKKDEKIKIIEKRLGRK